MTTFPMMGFPVREAMGLLKRAVTALETQAELMADPEPGPVPPDGSEVVGEGPGKYFKEEAVLELIANAVKGAKANLTQEIEGILNSGYAEDIKSRHLRDLIKKYAPPTTMGQKK
jgi:hypothetical protein